MHYFCHIAYYHIKHTHTHTQVLYKSTIDEIVDSIKSCWVSMFKDHILEYVANSNLMEGNKKISTPTMGVLIMKMVEAESSGVCFSRNLWGDKNETMIEAVLGQGEGLVSGSITPARYVVDKYSTQLCYSDVPAQQTSKFVKANNKDGVEMITLSPPHKGSVLSQSVLTKITNLARSIEEYYQLAQDIEWAVDAIDGKLYVLQSRPITTTDSSSLSFLPPGDGFWEFDPAHFPRPLSPWMSSQYSLDLLSHNSRRVGSLITSIKLRHIHGFAFSQVEMFPMSDLDKLERAAKSYWEKKLYEEDYQEFVDFFLPDCDRLKQELRIIDPASLSHSSLVKYVAKCYDRAAEFWTLHHVYTIPAIVIVGDYMNRMAELTGKDTMETLQLLQNSSPESRGLLNKKDPELSRMYELLKQNKKALTLLQCGSDKEDMSKWALDVLLHLKGELGELLRGVSLEYGWRLAGGYDLCVPAVIESPSFFIRSLLQGVEEDEDAMKKKEDSVAALTSAWRQSLPTEGNKRELFDEILDVGRRFFRMRDERGLATDLSGVALCRRGILEAGQRLTKKGIINAPEHLTVATKNEAMSLMTGDLRGLSINDSSSSGPIDVPTASILERRFSHIKHSNPQLVPKALGTPPPPPPPGAQLPQNVARTMANIDTAMAKGMGFKKNEENDMKEDANRSIGISASMGKVTGPVTLILQDSDLQKVEKGDIVVTYSTSASFNIVLALCSGIVTNYGGMLSHAAIVSREYGIPAIVGTENATFKFKSGDIVTLDSTTNSVTRVLD